VNNPYKTSHLSNKIKIRTKLKTYTKG